MTLLWEVSLSHTARHGSTYVPSRIHSLKTLLDRGETHHVHAAGLHRKDKKHDTAAPLRKQIWGPVVLLTVADRKSGGMVL
jgi:hypothetical protein